jgi:hypothetical protein
LSRAAAGLQSIPVRTSNERLACIRCRRQMARLLLGIAVSSGEVQHVLTSADEHVQTSGEPVGPNMATALPSARRGLDAQKQHAGLPALDMQPSAASIRLPEGAAPRVSAPAQGAASSYPDTYAASGPEPGTWKDPDPRRRSNRGSGAQNRPACAATAATRRLRPVPSQRFLALWSRAHTPSCSRQVTSTSIRMVKPGPASASRGHAPL